MHFFSRMIVCNFVVYNFFKQYKQTIKLKLYVLKEEIINIISISEGLGTFLQGKKTVKRP